VAGGIIQGSYHAGWQKSMHGVDDPRIAARNALNADKPSENWFRKWIPERSLIIRSWRVGITTHYT